MKTCSICRERKALTDFYVDARAKGGRRADCKVCARSRMRKHEHKPEVKARRREYDYAYWRRPGVKARKNESKRAAQRDYVQKRRENDPLFAEAGRMRARIASIFKLKGYRKPRALEEMLGCTVENYVAYLESLFEPGMSWRNRRDWEVDHIIPLSYAETLDDLIQLAHFTNTQPLWTEANRAKGNRWVG